MSRSGIWRIRAWVAVLGTAGLLCAPPPAVAVLDVEDRGPVLDAGRFTMRITNAGILGNAFFNKGLSFDPSLEFPKGSGHECLEHAELWVGARLEDGSATVSGGPMLEWRPTRDSADVVRVRYAAQRGSRPAFDDDGDGRKDEEFLDGADNDGDGEIDEDIRAPAQQVCAAVFTDDQREAVDYGYPNGEQHRPLGLAVHQEALSWALPGLDRVAGIHYTIRNHGTLVLRELWLGVYADLDSREGAGGPGHLDDVATVMRDSTITFDGIAHLQGSPPLYELSWWRDCYTRLGGEWPAIHDASPHSKDPWVAVLGLSHTTDPLGFLISSASAGADAARARARAPRRDSTIRYLVLSPSLPPTQGGPPSVDADRYAALSGRYAGAVVDFPRDYSVLVSCGPFAYLEPGQSLEFTVAFIVGEGADSLVQAAQWARLAWRGQRYNLQKDAPFPSLPSYPATDFTTGETGITGHEVCYEPPPGIAFEYDADCYSKFFTDKEFYRYDGSTPTSPPLLDEDRVDAVFTPGAGCVWADFDCDVCTGWDGTDEQVHWYMPVLAPDQPLLRATAGDREVTLEWDDLPEVLADAGVVPGPPYRFWGYRVYRLDRWQRQNALPPVTRWQQIASFAADTSLGAKPLADVLDPRVRPDSIAYERPHHPIGRYRFVDRRVNDGFDYHYVVTSVAARTVRVQDVDRLELLESPFRAAFADVIRPRLEAGLGLKDGRVWVVPNPYRGDAAWERPPVPGDAFTRHVDFFGLPRALVRIRIYTLAGDLVREVTHDGRQGAGQVGWDLISRNGQDVESGVYLFTVEWDGGHQTGKFVLIR